MTACRLTAPRFWLARRSSAAALPGRKSTQSQYAIKDLWIGSFLMPHEEERFSRRVCCVRGCDHRMALTLEQINAGEQPCSIKAMPGFAAVENDGEQRFDEVGMVCACHAAEIMDAERR